MTIKISQLTSLATVYGNVLIPVVSNIAGILTTVSSNVDQLTTFILGTVASDLANLTALTTANAEIQSGQISTLTANASSQHGQLIALTANAATQHDAIITSNVNLTGYADAITSAWTANAATQHGDITTLYANASTQLDSITALEGNVSIAQGNIITLAQGIVDGGGQITGLINGFANVLTYTNATISSNVSAGVKGDTAYDSNYIYFCVATDSWIRATRDVW
jgi:hypothetical protein